jgi:hypothetical protein
MANNSVSLAAVPGVGLALKSLTNMTVGSLVVLEDTFSTD